MRPIKFRAWLKEDKVMEDVTSLHMTPHRIYISDENISWTSEDIELMQFTGLLDKTGKEIWEGDIVRINHPQDMTGDFTNAIGDVFWWEEEGGWYHGNNNGRPPKRMWEYVEVIGNIYEMSTETLAQQIITWARD